jgi:hypothetical protein
MEKLVYKYILENIAQGSLCRKILDKDGINSSDLIVSRLPKIFDELVINMKSARIKTPKIGDTASIAKNLDEYQYLICSEVSSTPDQNPIKLELQKCRIAIIACFAKLIEVLKLFNGEHELELWNSLAQLILIKSSETLAIARTKQYTPRRSVKENDISNALNYFGIVESDLETDIRKLYI